MVRQLGVALAFTGVTAAIFIGRSLIAADAPAGAPPKAPPAAPKVSTFAPADDLLPQVDYYLGRLDETLANQDEFNDDAKAKLKKDANTLTAIALTLGLHDTANKVQGSAVELMKASQALAKAADYDAAKAALDATKKAAAGGDSNKSELTWHKAASMGQLMKQVPVVNAALKRGLTPTRFKQLQSASAGHAATLAAIAQTVMADTHEVKNPADIDKWYQYCADMRDAAGSANAAIRAGDLMATNAAMLKLTKSCDDCHAVFRMEE